MIQERLRLLREKMREHGVTVYVVPSSDCHESEYVCAHFRAREYLTGFDGSAGTAVVTPEEAGLWTDGRYFLQAQTQLQGTGIDLYRMEEPGVPKMEEYVKERLAEGGKLGFDGRTMNAFLAEKLVKAAEEKKAGLLATEDLVGAIWEERPPLPESAVFVLEEHWSGESVKSKLGRVCEEMERLGADLHVLASLCDICWILNLRGGDIPGVPVVLSFLCLAKKSVTWYVRPSAVTAEASAYLSRHQIQVKDYDAIYADLKNVGPEQRVLMDKKNVNYCLLGSVPHCAEVLDGRNPSERMKAVKNEIELRNLKNAHRKEGVAFARFMHWIKTRAGQEEITERSAARYLEERRKEQEHYLEPSFAPICAYGPHGAVVHYSATEESDAAILPEGFLLVDAGGHYLDGTTDTTRTFALGELTEGQKRMFTAVCKGNLDLANASFLYGCSGQNLDILCREPLWQMGRDYKHGTGHGVGYLLNVHEGPNAFRWRLRDEDEPVALEEGMVTTDEPGIYIEGEYGIRIENELACVKGEQNGYGQFMRFETLTLTPIDLDAILPEEMSGTQRAYLNAYHKKVYEALSPYLDVNERQWLKQYTREI